MPGQGRAGPSRPGPSLMPTPPTQDTEHSRDLESTLIRLEEEQQRWGAAGKGRGRQRGPPQPQAHWSLFVLPRSSSLAQVNAMLREQLDQANSANQVLSEDIRKVTSDWTRSRKELEQREAAWRREEEVSMGVLGGQRGPRGSSLTRVVGTGTSGKGAGGPCWPDAPFRRGQ